MTDHLPVVYLAYSYSIATTVGCTNDDEGVHAEVIVGGEPVVGGELVVRNTQDLIEAVEVLAARLAKISTPFVLTTRTGPLLTL